MAGNVPDSEYSIQDSPSSASLLFSHREDDMDCMPLPRSCLGATDTREEDKICMIALVNWFGIVH